MLSQDNIDKKAREIDSYLQDAAGETAFNTPFDLFEPELQKKIRKAKKDGVTDIKGWLADEIYSDVNFLRDMAGDQIHDACMSLGIKYSSKEFNLTFVRIACSLSENKHPSLKQACKMLIGERGVEYKNIKDDPRSTVDILDKEF